MISGCCRIWDSLTDPMEPNELYSIRMRASLRGEHISGAERIVSQGQLERTVQELLQRARQKAEKPDHIVVKLDEIRTAELNMLTALDIVTVNVSDVITARSLASRILEKIGVSGIAVERAINALGSGAAAGKNMRGAMIMDARSGERLETDEKRGVRVSRFDWTDAALVTSINSLEDIGLTHHRTREALALATKVAHAPALVAELCWSDDPDYTAGYVASLGTGYVRFPMLKKRNDPYGGRVFFVDRSRVDLAVLYRYFQTEAVLINGIGRCRPALEPADYFA